MNKIFPHISTKITPFNDNPDTVTIKHSTWVRVKRKKTYYKVLCVVTCLGYTEDSDFHLVVLRSLDSLTVLAEQTYYLWELPSKSMQERLIESKSLVKDVRYLTNKELFLLNFGG